MFRTTFWWSYAFILFGFLGGEVPKLHWLQQTRNWPMLEYMALNERGGELFKKDFRKLLSLKWKYFKKTLIKNSVFQNIKQKHNTEKTIGCFTETIGCLYQLSINKTKFKEIGIERLYTVVYTRSLQTQSYIQSSQKPWGNPLSNHTLITYTTTKRMTLNTSRNTLSLVNTPTLRLLILIP